MNARNLALIAALAVAPAAARAQDAAAPAPARDVAADVDTVTGRVDALTERLAEAETAVGALKKLKFSGYVQARFADGQKGSYQRIFDSGYSDLDREGFHVRRGRLKAAYDAGGAEAVIQVDATASGVSLKEAYARLKLPFGVHVDAGQVGIPFGYEVGVVSSSALDLLERSSVVRKMLAGEYDRGVLAGWRRGAFSVKAGVLNGNGVDGWTKDNDALKDFVGRAAYDFRFLNVGVSGWFGKLRLYKDASATLPAGDYDRTRLGVDVQAWLDLLPIGGTAVKAEFLQGQTILGKSDSLANVAKLAVEVPQVGWYVTLSQAIGASDTVAVRYDFHDENTDAADGDAAAKATGTLALAWHHHFGGNVKASVLYEIPTQLKGPDGFEDPEDNALTLQLQASF